MSQIPSYLLACCARNCQFLVPLRYRCAKHQRQSSAGPLVPVYDRQQCRSAVNPKYKHSIIFQLFKIYSHNYAQQIMIKGSRIGVVAWRLLSSEKNLLHCWCTKWLTSHHSNSMAPRINFIYRSMAVYCISSATGTGKRLANVIWVVGNLTNVGITVLCLTKRA